MKHNTVNEKITQNSRWSMLVLVFFLVSFGATPFHYKDQANKDSVSFVAISNYLHAQRNPKITQEEKIKTAIDAYFALRYEGQKLMRQQDFSLLLGYILVDAHTIDRYHYPVSYWAGNSFRWITIDYWRK